MDMSMSSCAPVGLPSVCVTMGRRGSTYRFRLRSQEGFEQNVYCRSLSSIHILYNHDPVQALYSLPGQRTRVAMYYCPEVVQNTHEDTCTSMQVQIHLKYKADTSKIRKDTRPTCVSIDATSYHLPYLPYLRQSPLMWCALIAPQWIADLVIAFIDLSLPCPPPPPPFSPLWWDSQNTCIRHVFMCILHRHQDTLKYNNIHVSTPRQVPGIEYS